MGACELGNEPSGSIKCGELLTSFSRRTVLRGVSKYHCCVRGVVYLLHLVPSVI